MISSAGYRRSTTCSTSRIAAEQHAAQLRAGILEREVNVARAREAQARDLTRHPDLAHLVLEQPPDLPGQFRDGQNLPRRLRGFSRLGRLCRTQFAKVPL